MRGDSMAIEQAAAGWLARRDGGQWGADDEAALQHWLDADVAHRVALLRLQAAWQESGRLQALGAGWQDSAAPARGHWQATPSGRREQMLQAMAQRPATARPARQRRLARFAMAATLAGGALALAWGWRSQARVDTAAYRTAMGEVRTLPLADGSRATLASATGIEVRLSARARDVALTSGEAIFEVAKDPRRPFAVAADGYRAVAVGTRFSVRRDGPDLRVVVTEGTVRLESDPVDGRSHPAALLPAGSLATVGPNGVLVRSVPLAQAQRYLEWRDGFLAFDDVPLAQAADEFNRFNVRRLVLADPEVAGVRIGGNFRWSNLDGFVGLLEQGFPVRAERHPDRIVLHSR